MRYLNSITLALLLSVLTTTGRAQVVEKTGLTLEGAKKVAAAALAEAKKNKATGVVAVVDDGGNLMYLERLDDTFAAGANISIGKARTAALFKRPTKAFEDIIRNGRTPMIALHDFTPLQGGVPLEYNGKIIGGVGVSGANSAQQDEEIAIAGANALKSRGHSGAESASSGVIYIPGDQVTSAFQKGAVLLNNGDYMVHASHREGPGMVEVHDKDTDIIYVLEGSATFITGGSVVDGKVVEPDETRGASIRHGERRTIAKGDVVVVPNGVPHWFQEIKGPLNYYVVKVR